MMKTTEKRQKPTIAKKLIGQYKTLDEAATAKVKQVEKLLEGADWSTFKK